MSLATASFADGWRMARFDEILRRVERLTTIEGDVEYASVGVRWYGNGAFVRERRMGADIAGKRQSVLRAGEVVYNKLFAWKGAFANVKRLLPGHTATLAPPLSSGKA